MTKTRLTRRLPGESYEEMRKRLGWPTPNAMRTAARALDLLTIARFGDVLRWVADLCDDSLTRDSQAEALVKACHEANIYSPVDLAAAMRGYVYLGRQVPYLPLDDD